MSGDIFFFSAWFQDPKFTCTVHCPTDKFSVSKNKQKEAKYGTQFINYASKHHIRRGLGVNTDNNNEKLTRADVS